MSTVEWPGQYRPLPAGYTVELVGGTHYAVVFADREVSEIHWDKYTVRRWAFQIAAHAKNAGANTMNAHGERKIRENDE